MAFIKDIDPSTPEGASLVSEGDDQIRALKDAVKSSFGGVDGGIVNESGDPASAADINALFTRLDALESNSGVGSVPVGMIAIWTGTDQNIPAGWHKCDGTEGRPNMTNAYIVGAGSRALNSTGGSSDTGNGGDGSGTATLSLPDHNITVDNLPEHTHPVFVAGEGSDVTAPGSGFAGAIAQSHPSNDDRKYTLSEAAGEANQGKSGMGGGVPTVAPLEHPDTDITINGIEHNHSFEPPFYAVTFIIYTG